MEIFGYTFSESLVILVSAFVIWILSQTFASVFVHSMTADTPTGKRLRTLVSLVRTVSSVVIVTIAAFMILRELGFDMTPVIASAGIAGIALGFGAQTLVKDVIAGVFILMENQFDEGDEVEISGKKGIIEKVSLRVVSIRDKNDSLHIIPNGSIIMVTNFSRKSKSLKS